MADDTRQSTSQAPREDLSREALNAHPENKAFTGNQWDNGKSKTFNLPANANSMEGGSVHTAGGQVPEVTLWNALHAGRPITEVHKQPCVRDSYMVGIGSGFAAGGLRAIFGGMCFVALIIERARLIIHPANVWKSCNWAVGSAALGSIVMYQYCQYRRHAEKAGMTRAVEILHRKEIEKQAREQRKAKLREERREAKDKEQDAKLAELKRNAEGKPWWKVW